jgi:hypothetical protein
VINQTKKIWLTNKEYVVLHGMDCWLQDQNFDPKNSGLVLRKIAAFQYAFLYIYIGLIT